MTTDFTAEAPHTDYECTLHVRGTKALFHVILDLLKTSEPQDEAQARVKDVIKSEIEDIIIWMVRNEGYYKSVKK